MLAYHYGSSVRRVLLHDINNATDYVRCTRIMEDLTLMMRRVLQLCRTTSSSVCWSLTLFGISCLREYDTLYDTQLLLLK